MLKGENNRRYREKGEELEKENEEIEELQRYTIEALALFAQLKQIMNVWTAFMSALDIDFKPSKKAPVKGLQPQPSLNK